MIRAFSIIGLLMVIVFMADIIEINFRGRKSNYGLSRKS